MDAKRLLNPFALYLMLMHSKNWFFYIGFLLLLGFTACEPCQDCGPQNAYPYIKLKFFNQEAYDYYKPQQDSLTAVIKDLNAQLKNNKSDSLQKALDEAKSAKQTVDAQLTLINNNKNRMVSLNGDTSIFRNEKTNDTLSLFPFPIDVNHDTSRYAIQLPGKHDSLVLSYKRSQSYVNGKVSYDIYNLRVLYHSFDSLSAPNTCEGPSDCLSNNQTLYAVF